MGELAARPPVMFRVMLPPGIPGVFRWRRGGSGRRWRHVYGEIRRLL